MADVEEAMLVSIERLAPNTRLSDLTVSDLLDVIGWALTYYKSTQVDDVGGFLMNEPRQVLPLINEHWRGVHGQWWMMDDITGQTDGSTITDTQRRLPPDNERENAERC